MQPGEWTLRSRRVVTPSGTVAADVLIRGQAILAVRGYDDPETDGVILDLGDRLVVPGLVDIRPDLAPGSGPGGLGSATVRAASGGVTAILGPSVALGTAPPDPDAYSDALAGLDGTLRVDCGFFAPLLPATGGRIEGLVEAGVFGFKASPGASGTTEADLRDALPRIARTGRPLLARVGPGAGAGGEAEAIRMLAGLIREGDCRVHIARVDSAEGLSALARARDEVSGLTASVRAIDLLVSADPSGPDRLWDALRSGVVDSVTSEGTSSAASSARHPFPGVWAEAGRRGFDPGAVALWTSTRPAELLGLAGRKGIIAPGSDADFAVLDPVGPSVVAGLAVVRGAIVQVCGHPEGTPRGEALIRLEETLPAPDGLERLNALDPRPAEEAIRLCCGSTRWARAMAALRPFASTADLLDAADRIWTALDRADRLEAIAAHARPRDADGPPEPPDEDRAALADARRVYERKFGHPFVTEHQGPAVLHALWRRLGNDPEAELAVAAEEQAKLTRHALRQLVA